jgi:hypothetical protein
MNTSIPTTDNSPFDDVPIHIITITGQRYEPTETDLALVGPETYQEIRLNDEPISIVLDGQIIPLISGFTPAGQPIRAVDIQLYGTTDPATCDHANGCYSDNIATKCPACRIPIFLPPHLLAHLPRATVETMHQLWRAAGWPAWEDDDWAVNRDQHILITEPLFARTGGIPVRRDRIQMYVDAMPLPMSADERARILQDLRP